MTLSLLTRWRCSARLFRATAVLPTLVGAGCTIPIAVFPAPGPGGGREIVFLDEQGAPIRTDGLMIVHRRESFRSCLVALQCAPSNHVVTVRQGRARVPQDWTLASVSLTSNELFLGYGLMGFTEKPLLASGLVISGLPPLIPVANPLDNSVFILPLVPGYHARCWGDDARAWACRSSVVGRGRVDNPAIQLRHSADHPHEAAEYWQDCLSRLRRRYEEPAFTSGPDLRLEVDDYFKVKAFIEFELASIPATQPNEPQTGPSD